MAKPQTYLELISQDEKKVQKEGLQIKAQEAVLEVQKEIMSLNSSINKKKQVLAKAQRQIPYNPNSEYLVTKELVELESKLEFLTKLKEERFSDVTI